MADAPLDCRGPAHEQAGSLSLEAIVLAGGLGTRLRSVVDSVPKVLAPVAGKPFLAHLLDRLRDADCIRVTLAVSYMHEQIERVFGPEYAGMEIEYSIEDSPLGTGGGIRQALARIESRDALVINGDTWLEVDYQTMLQAHIKSSARVSIAVTPVECVARYGAVLVDSMHTIVGFSEKGSVEPGLINAGVYAVSKDVFDGFDLPAAFSFESDFLSRHCNELRPLAIPVDACFIDIGVPESYQLAQTLIASRTSS